MSTFKTALRMALAHPFYLLIYTVSVSYTHLPSPI